MCCALIPHSMHHHLISQARTALSASRSLYSTTYYKFRQSCTLSLFLFHRGLCLAEAEPITKRQLIWEMAKRGHGFDRGSLLP